MLHAPATLTGLTIARGPGGDGWRVARASGPDPARILLGRAPQEAARLVPLVFNLCGAAHGLAAAAALGLPAGGPDCAREMARETARDHARAILLDWPLALGAAPDRASLGLLARPDGAPALVQALVGEAAGLAAFTPGVLEAWLREGRTGTARLLARLRHEVDPQEGRAALPRLTPRDVAAALRPATPAAGAREPEGGADHPGPAAPAPGPDGEGAPILRGPSRDPAPQDPAAQDQSAQDQAAQDPAAQNRSAQGSAIQDPAIQHSAVRDPAIQDPAAQDPAASALLFETGALDRMAGSPLLQALLAQEGSSLFVRLLARLLDLLAALRGDVPESPAPAPGMGLAPAARGLLGHGARVEAGRVAAYRVLSPSAWNLAPGGLLDRAFVALSPQGAHLAPLLVSAINPCVPVTFETEAAHA